MKARRNDAGKIRKELIPIEFIDALAQVYTMGAEKYSLFDEEGNVTDDGADNWRKGLSWRKTLGAIRRHLDKCDKGEDFDYDWPKELVNKYGPTLHLANAAWGIATLISQYKHHPELDDRLHQYLKPRKIGLDIDGVLADFTGHLMAVSENHGHVALHWNDPVVRREFEKVKKDKKFWATIPPLIKPDGIPFEVHCYITARSIDPAITQEWLDNNLFPTAPLYCVGVGESKIEVAKKAGMDIFVDDSYHNFVELNNAGICTYLFTAPYNEKYNVGYKRIYSLKELA